VTVDQAIVQYTPDTNGLTLFGYNHSRVYVSPVPKRPQYQRVGAVASAVDANRKRGVRVRGVCDLQRSGGFEF